MRDSCLPWLIDLPSCDSTNTWARQRLAELSHGDVVFTARQTAGRGRGTRVWHAPPGVCCASWVIEVAPSVGGLLALVAGLAVCDAVQDLGCQPQRLGLKWPNDVLLDGGKLAGILCEGAIHGGRLRTVVGIGLNLDPDWQAAGLGPEAFPDLPRPPASLRAAGLPCPEPRQILADIRLRLLAGAAMLDNGRWPALRERLRERDALLGRALVVDEPSGMLRQGQGAGIDDSGYLLLALPDGGCIAIGAGSVLEADAPAARASGAGRTPA